MNNFEYIITVFFILYTVITFKFYFDYRKYRDLYDDMETKNIILEQNISNNDDNLLGLKKDYKTLEERIEKLKEDYEKDLEEKINLIIKIKNTLSLPNNCNNSKIIETIEKDYKYFLKIEEENKKFKDILEKIFILLELKKGTHYLEIIPFIKNILKSLHKYAKLNTKLTINNSKLESENKELKAEKDYNDKFYLKYHNNMKTILNIGFKETIKMYTSTQRIKAFTLFYNKLSNNFVKTLENERNKY